MKRYNRNDTIPDNRISQDTYPMWGIVVVVGLLFLSPFLSSLPSYAAFVICLYRLVRYDAKVFAADYCILAPMAQVFCTTTGMSMLVYLVLLAAVWHILRGGIQGGKVYVALILLLNYLVARMQLNVTNFLLCFGHLCMLCVILPKQDSESAVFAAKAFCLSLLISSGYALVFRNTWQLRSILGREAEAIWGTGIMRFRGLIADPNYYMTLLVIGLALLAKLKECGGISAGAFVAAVGGMIVLGILTYSKAYVVMLVMFVFIYIIWQFYNRKHIRGMLLMLCVVGFGLWLLLSQDSPFAVVLARFADNGSLNAITTGRTDVYDAYLKEITATPGNFLFGKGLNALGLVKDPHNLYIELMYYIGVIGLVLYIGFFAEMVNALKKTDVRIHRQNVVAKYAVIAMAMVVFFSLHGMFQQVFYADAFLVLMSVLIVPGEDDKMLNQQLVQSE